MNSNQADDLQGIKHPTAVGTGQYTTGTAGTGQYTTGTGQYSARTGQYSTGLDSIERSSIRSRTIQWGQELLFRLNDILSLQVYSSHTEGQKQSQVRQVCEYIWLLLESNSELRVIYERKDFLLNKIWLGLSEKDEPNLSHLKQIWHQSNIGEFWISEPPSIEEFKLFLGIFHDMQRQGTVSFEELFLALSKLNLHWASFQKKEGDDLRHAALVSRKKSAQQAYYQSVNTVKKLYYQAEKGQELQWKQAKRTIQSILNILLDPFAQLESNQLLLHAQLKNVEDYFCTHAVNVAIYAMGFGHHLGLERMMLRDIGVASLLSDIGMLKVPKELHSLPELNAWQSEQIKQHPVHAVPLLLNTPFLDRSVLRTTLIAFTHHLCTISGGYPVYGRGLQGLASQIVAIADRYDALTSSRPYRKEPRTASQALADLVNMSKKDLDPILVRQFIQWLGAHPVGTILHLTTGEIGYVVKLGKPLKTRELPVIKLLYAPPGQKEEFIHLSEKDAQGANRWTIERVLDSNDPRLQLALLKDLEES